MSTFDEGAHPRGQAANAGQFRTKTNSAPAGELSGGADDAGTVTLQLRAHGSSGTPSRPVRVSPARSGTPRTSRSSSPR